MCLFRTLMYSEINFRLRRLVAITDNKYHNLDGLLYGISLGYKKTNDLPRKRFTFDQMLTAALCKTGFGHW